MPSLDRPPLVQRRDPFRVNGLSPELHARRVEPAFGDFYGVCSCGARSLPLVRAIDAARWVCPRDEAEASVVKAATLWRQRVADASMVSR